jgi:multidrug efflux pump
MNLVARNNRLVAAGTLNTKHGRFAVKVPGLFESVEDIMNLPVKQTDDFVVTLKDIASVHRTFDDTKSIVRLNGKTMTSIDVSKRVGANIVDISSQLKAGVEAFSKQWSSDLQVFYLQDESLRVINTLNDLENNVIFSTLLVMIVVVSILGLKSGVMVGLAIPGSFLAGILCLSLFGMTLNMVVLFALILSVGMLVDASIVVIEYADRRMKEGALKRDAYAEAAIRMAWPIAASTATTLAVFAPLMFWPGVMGQFMLYLPLTLMFTLSASFMMAMILMPTIGSLGDKHELTLTPENISKIASKEQSKNEKLDKISLWYLEKLEKALQQPKKVLYLCIALMIFSFTFYGILGNGTNFFPDSEPNFASIRIKARGELSLTEKDFIVKQVESKVFDTAGIDKFYTTIYNHPPGQASADTIGIIRLELSHWKSREKAKEIFSVIRKKVKSIAGVIIEVRSEERGPASGRDIELEINANDYRVLIDTVEKALELLKQTPGLIDVQDSRPPPGFEWQLKVDREKASQFGVDLSDVGDTIRLVTNGVKLGEYRPDDAEDEVDIKIRYPISSRSLDQFEQLRITMGDRLVPISSFVEQKPAAKLSSVNRVNGKYALTVEADVEEGYLTNDLIKALEPKLEKTLDKNIGFQFKGKNEDQAESRNFLLKAFGVAIFAMAIILVTQFNSFYQAFLILTAVIFSINGVLYGLLLRGEPFSIVMSGVGIISLAGIVVNNNIVLIDTFNILKRQGLDTLNAAMQTGAQRLRPILLTTVTTILGLLPMVFQINIKLISQEIDFGAPSGQTWAQLSTAIAAGLAFATPITLFLTPCLLVLGDKNRNSKEPANN